MRTSVYDFYVHRYGVMRQILSSPKHMDILSHALPPELIKEYVRVAFSDALGSDPPSFHALNGSHSGEEIQDEKITKRRPTSASVFRFDWKSVHGDAETKRRKLSSRRPLSARETTKSSRSGDRFPFSSQPHRRIHSARSNSTISESITENPSYPLFSLQRGQSQNKPGGVTAFEPPNRYNNLSPFISVFHIVHFLLFFFFEAVIVVVVFVVLYVFFCSRLCIAMIFKNVRILFCFLCFLMPMYMKIL